MPFMIFSLPIRYLSKGIKGTQKNILKDERMVGLTKS